MAKISQYELFSMAISGAITATGYADVLLNKALTKYGSEKPIGYPNTGYELPCFYGWTAIPVKKLGDLPALLGEVRRGIREEATYENALKAGEATMFAAEIVEALGYIDNDAPYAEKAPPGLQEYCGFVGDSVLRKLGIALVDDTIPGTMIFVGKASDSKKLANIIRASQSKGILIMAAFDIIKQLQDENIKMGTDIMLYPLGEFTQVIHGLNFAIRAALTFGGIKRGDRKGLYDYLSKRPKVVIIQLGPLDNIKVSAEFAVLFNGSPTITDQDVESIPGKYISQPDYSQILQTAIEIRDMKPKLAPVDIPVAYGPAFEGESIRKEQMYLEAGGTRTIAFEYLRMHEKPENVENGKITFVGKDVDELPEMARIPLAILVDVYGKKMQKDFESVLERRIHQFINFAEGCWHAGQRNMIWIRLSKDGVKKGLKLRHIGNILHTKLHSDFSGIVSRVQVTIITDESELKKHLPEALDAYKARDLRIKDLTDESVNTFYSCTLCQSFAPNHVCIITPERLGLCGAINWLDGKAGYEIAPTGPNQPWNKGEVLDATKGQWKGINEAVSKLSHGKIERFNVYSIIENPTTSCGCFECILAIVPEANGILVVNREYQGNIPIGMKFSTLAGTVGGGSQTPGFLGVGRRYLLSRKFISADGGFFRIVWMPKMLKEDMRAQLIERAKELGTPEFVDKIADETIATTIEELVAYLEKVKHPALTMLPIM